MVLSNSLFDWLGNQHLLPETDVDVDIRLGVQEGQFGLDLLHVLGGEGVEVEADGPRRLDYCRLGNEVRLGLVNSRNALPQSYGI